MGRVYRRQITSNQEGFSLVVYMFVPVLANIEFGAKRARVLPYIRVVVVGVRDE